MQKSPVVRLRLAATILLTIWTGPLSAQIRAPVDGGRTISLGQPRSWSWTAGVATGSVAGGGDAPDVAQARFGAYHTIGNPVVGALAVHLEAYAGARSGAGDGGARARLLFPFARVGVGADLSAGDGRARAIYSMVFPGRRGGLFRDGSVARFDYVPARANSFTAAIEIPIFREVPTGRTRPPRDRVRITGPLATPAPPLDHVAGADDALAVARDAARRIRVLTVPFLGREGAPTAARMVPIASGASASDATGADLPEHLRLMKEAMSPLPGNRADASAVRTVELETSRFHDAIDRAFSAAADGSAGAGDSSTVRGRLIGDSARAILLAEVLLPYDRLLGQTRERDTIRRYGHVAQGVFVRALHASGGLTGQRAADALSVFSALIEIIEENRSAIVRAWGDTRFAWLPLQYALRPEQHDTQRELDALVARAVDEPFTEGNFVSYVFNEQFQYQLSRTIRLAEDYHILVTHDFRGIDDIGDPDSVAYRQVVHSYLRAMIDRVKAYDRTGTFPTYMILHDQWYYSLREGPLFLRLLEDPTRHRVRLPRAFRAWEDTIAARQDELRAAIAGSSLLQAQRRQFGDDWLRDLVKVHVNVTNRPDQTFWSWKLIPGLPVGDNILRDHRKLVFYDITEADAYRGEALYTGAGVGLHYASGAWEDRSLLVRGPALLGLKDAARTLLLAHGITPERIPYVLQPREKSEGYEAQVRDTASRNALTRRAVGVHNGSGYMNKRVNVAKAVLYTLMPAGSVIIVPDSFWASDFWGSALFGASLRGGRVLLIAPSNASNSVEFFGTQQLSRELLSRLLVAREVLGPELRSLGGQIRVGIYDSDLAVNDIPGKVGAASRTFAETEWLRALFGFPDKVYTDLGALEDAIAQIFLSRGVARSAPGTEPRTKLHLKANFFASREAWTLMTRPEWGNMTWAFVMARLGQVTTTETVTRFESPPTPLLDVGSSEVNAWYEGLTPAKRERVMFYTVMGSQNQNYRSMVTDAEDAFVVANWPSVIPYLDAISLIGQSRWVESQADIDAMIPRATGIQLFMAHWGRLVF